MFEQVKRVRLMPSTGTEETPQIDQTSSRKERFLQLHSSILPHLRNQLTTSKRALESEFQENPGPKLKLVSEIECGLYDTIQQIKSAIVIIFPKREPFGHCSITNDQHLNELKYFRLHWMEDSLNPLLSDLEKVTKACLELIRQLKLSAEDSDYRNDINFARKPLVDDILHALEKIESSIVWLSGSELEIVQARWTSQTSQTDIDEKLEALMQLIISPGHINPEIRRLQRVPRYLARQVIPILKLSRLFFKKLSKREMNQYRPQKSFTQMCTNDMACLANTQTNIVCKLKDIMNYMASFQRSPRGAHATTFRLFTETANRIKTYFQHCIFIIHLYILPLIANTDSFSTQDHFKNWLLTWNTQFTLAHHNFLHEVNTFLSPSS
ncbi:hypothetical protein H4Q26_011838 [Puccinia striiformis f. sp. tritici PST-130]|nr:hypothetical protein Pst134EB_006428 [Puccinia striiformis f. sp. tritici]KAI9619158.1 hypothetical protein H4Q26_011838 [Puccinia striiformis f. sp. tritici PST-130]